MSLKEEELQKAKEVAVKFECELKEITLKHTSVNDQSAPMTRTHFKNFCFHLMLQSLFSVYLTYELNQVKKN